MASDIFKSSASVNLTYKSFDESDFHRPCFLRSPGFMPVRAASVAPPIRNECRLKFWESYQRSFAVDLNISLALE